MMIKDILEGQTDTLALGNHMIYIKIFLPDNGEKIFYSLILNYFLK